VAVSYQNRLSLSCKIEMCLSLVEKEKPVSTFIRLMIQRRKKLRLKFDYSN